MPTERVGTRRGRGVGGRFRSHPPSPALFHDARLGNQTLGCAVPTGRGVARRSLSGHRQGIRGVASRVSRSDTWSRRNRSTPRAPMARAMPVARDSPDLETPPHRGPSKRPLRRTWWSSACRALRPRIHFLGAAQCLERRGQALSARRLVVQPGVRLADYRRSVVAPGPSRLVLRGPRCRPVRATHRCEQAERDTTPSREGTNRSPPERSPPGRGSGCDVLLAGPGRHSLREHHGRGRLASPPPQQHSRRDAPPSTQRRRRPLRAWSLPPAVRAGGAVSAS